MVIHIQRDYELTLPPVPLLKDKVQLSHGSLKFQSECTVLPVKTR